MALGRKTGGRKAGTPNKATADIKAAAALHGAAALAALAEIAKGKKQPPAARVAAAVALLDRAYGKPSQAISGPGGGPIPMTQISMTPDEFRALAAEMAGKV